MIKRIYRHLSKPANLATLNGVLIAILIGLNIYFQGFCIPTTWSIILLALCFTNTTLYPILCKTSLAPLTSFINGITLFVFIYCVIFLENMILPGLVMILLGIGWVFLIPHFFIVQIIWRNIVRPAGKTSRTCFLAAVILCLGIVFYIGNEYNNTIASIERFKESNYQELEKNFMTEKILGMHFIYHTRFCEYDGWRPPKHEPILVIGMWLNNRLDPLNVDLTTRLELYKRFFPAEKYKFDCSCAIQYSNDYHKDGLWKK